MSGGLPNTIPVWVGGDACLREIGRACSSLACHATNHPAPGVPGDGDCLGANKERWGPMRRMILIVGAIAIALSSAHASDFRHGNWFGEEDWETESCRISQHVQDRYFFFAEENWEGKFDIGIYSDELNFRGNYTISGAVVFDAGIPIMLEGSGSGSRLTFSARNSERLKQEFTRKHSLRLSFADMWVQIPLRGSARATELLSACAKNVWPGAGDQTDYVLGIFIERNIIAFTSEPNDLGAGKDFLLLYPMDKCEFELLDDGNYILYSCSLNSGVQKFHFRLDYDDSTLVLSGVSLDGEGPNLGPSLTRLQRQLVPELTQVRQQSVAIPYRFNDFPVEQSFNGRTRLPDFHRRDKDYRTFRTRIREKMNEGPDFASHYSLIAIGCGTLCSIVFAGNNNTGQVYDFPLEGEENSSLELLYDISSRLVVAQWTNSDLEACVRQYYEWTGDNFRLLDTFNVVKNACYNDIPPH